MDSTETSFRMFHAREAISRGWVHIERQVTAAENAVRDEPTLVFDLARTLIESTCRTILTERQVAYSRNANLPSLFSIVRLQLSFLPPAASSEDAARQSLNQALGGLYSTIQGISELRNEYGFASHGHETDIPQMERTQAILVAGAADVIIGFLYRVHVQDRTVNTTTSRSLYEENRDFNNFIDESHDICTILESEFWPSDVLFQLEPETYRSYLAEFRAEAEGSEEADT